MAGVKNRNVGLQISVLTAALLGTYGYANAAGPVAYTPHPVNMDGDSWTKDRGGSPVLENVEWQGRDALKLAIDPPATPDTFNNWQGYSQRTAAAAGESFLRGDIWIQNDWQNGTTTNFQNTGMWGSAMPKETVAGDTYVDAKAVFPIMHFSNQKDANGNPDGKGMLRIWDTTANSTGGWIYLPETAGLIKYDGWNSMDLRLVPEKNRVEYYFNGQLVHTWVDPTASDESKPGQFFAMYLKARNNGETKFDTYWSRLLAGTVYHEGAVSGAIDGDVLVDAGALVSVSHNTSIGGSLHGNGGAAAPTLVNMEKGVAIGGGLIGTNTMFNFSSAPDAVATIQGNVELEAKSLASGGSKENRIQANQNIRLNDSTLRGYWHLPNGSVIAQNGAVIENADIQLANASTEARSGLVVSGNGPVVRVRDSAIASTGAGTGNGDLVKVVDASNNAVVNIEGGSISATGSTFTRGIVATTGANVTTNGTNISTVGSKSHAVQAQVEGNDTTSKLPAVTINHGNISTKGNESWGLFSQRGGQITANHVTVATEGQAGFGAFVESNNEANARGGRISLNGGSITTTGGPLANTVIGSFGALSKNAGNHIEINGTRITTSGAYADGLRAEDKATIRATNAAISVSGDETAAAKAVGGAKIEMIDGSVINNSLQDKTRGAAAEGAGSVFMATNTLFQVAGVGTPEYSTQGVRAANGGQAILTGGSILTTGASGAQGLRAENATAQATGVAITTAGNRSYGVYSNNNSAVTLAQTNINTNGQFAHGVLVGNNSGASISNSSIRTRGNNASGVRAESSTSGMPGGALTVSNSQIRTSGANAHGVDLNGGSSLVMTGGSIHATGSGSAGVYLLNNSSATLNGVSVVAGGPSLQSYFSGPERSQTITIGAGTSLMQNNGTLLQVTRGTNQAQTTSGADGKVTLNLQSGSYASGNIRNFDANGNLASGALTSVVVQPGAQWAGVVVDNSTKIIENDQAPQTDFSTGDGESVVIEGGSAPHVFNGTTNIGGGSSIGPNQQVVFNGPTTIRDNLVGQQGSGMIIGGSATIGGSVTGAQGSTIAFNGPATITQSLQGAGGALFSFAGGASIGLNVSGMDGAAFRFSQLGVTSIGGNIDLDGGSVIGGGSQAAPITVAGNANVGNNSVLGGNLNIRGDLRMNGSSLAPGNSIGRVVVNSASQLTDSTYLAEVNGKGEADLIVVQTGDVNLTGVNLRVGQENGNGGYLLNHDYTIVQTEAGNIVGPFANGGELDSSFAGTLVKLDPVKYGAKATQVSLSLDASKVSGARTGLTGNQPAVFDGALSVVGRNASADAVMLMGTTEQRRNALDQLSGEIHGSTTAALYGASNLLGSTVSKRMAGNLGAGKLAGSPTAQASGAVAGSLPKSAAYPLWAEVVGNWNTLDAKDNASKTKTDTAGIYIGADTAVGRGWRVGAALGFTDGRVKADDVGSRSDVRSYTAALYGGNSWAAGKGQVNLLAGAGYTRHEIDSRRRIDVGGAQTLKADYDANTTQLFAELGYALPVGQASVLEPYAGLAWFSHHSKSFSESGGAAALQGDSQRDNITTFTLGLRGKTALDLKGKQARLSAGLGWRHAAGDVDANRTMSFIQGNGAAFTVAGSPVAKNAAVVDLGAEMDVGKNAAMGLGYSGQFGNGSTDNTGSLYLKVRF